MSNQNEKQLIQLPPNALGQLDYVSTRHDAVVQQGVDPKAILVPSFWAHHAVKMKPMDEIRARAEDGTWVAYLIVTDASRTWAKVQQLSLHRLTTADVAMTQANEADVEAFKAAHKVVHRGPRGWSIVRKGDDAVIAEDKSTKPDALAELDRLARTQSSPSAETVAA